MEESAKTGPGRRDAELAALIACSAVTAGFVIYWALQIQSVREMLALAYG